LFRLTYGNGVSLPTLSSGSDKFETLWRTQIGVETNDIPFLWVKLNGFYDKTNNVKLKLQFFDDSPESNHSLTREGFEVEAKTTPILNTTLGLGYTYTHIFNTEYGTDIQGLPRHHLILSANYRAHGTDASLYARYINWNSPSATDQVVWDFLLSQRLFAWETGNANLTVSILNMTNASQQISPMLTNPPLRAIAGFSVNF
jgi:vitamin B12 transporter